MTENKKERFTYRTMLADAIELFKANAATLPNGGADHIESAERLMERLTKKNSGEKKLTESQVQSVKDSEAVFEFLKTVKPHAVGKTTTNGATVSEIIRGIPDFTARLLTPQYVTSVVKHLLDNDSAVKSTIGGRTYFAVAE